MGSKLPWTAVALPPWLCHDQMDLWHQRPRWNTLSFTTTEIVWGYHGSPLLSAAQLVWPCTASHILYQICHKFLTPENKKSKEGLERRGLNVWRLMSVIVAWQALTPKTKMYRAPEFDWCCQPHEMRPGHHLNLKMDMDGWMQGWVRGNSKVRRWEPLELLPWECNHALRHNHRSQSWLKIKNTSHISEIGSLKYASGTPRNRSENVLKPDLVCVSLRGWNQPYLVTSDAFIW